MKLLRFPGALTKTFHQTKHEALFNWRLRLINGNGQEQTEKEQRNHNDGDGDEDGDGNYAGVARKDKKGRRQQHKIKKTIKEG